MKKSEAIKKVEAYLKIQNEREMDMVPVYTSKVKKWLVSNYNYLKCIKGFRLFWKIEISDWIKPDSKTKEYFIINKRVLKETPYYWLISWGSFKFVEEYDFNFSRIGPGPIVVEKTTGRMFHTDTTMLEMTDKMEMGEKIDLDTPKDYEILSDS